MPVSLPFTSGQTSATALADQAQIHFAADGHPPIVALNHATRTNRFRKDDRAVLRKNFMRLKPSQARQTKLAKRNPYPALLHTVVTLLDEARRASARTVNVIMTATYWQVGRHIVEHEQAGEQRADYGQQLLGKLSADLTKRFGRGFSADNLETMRLFYLAYLDARKISETPSRKLLPTVTDPVSAEISETVSRKSSLALLTENFPLSWSHYVMLVRRSRSPEARAFYESEALRGGWSVRQLDRQMSTLFYERTALSRNKAAMLRKGARPRPSDRVTPEEEIKHPLVLEFLGLNRSTIAMTNFMLHMQQKVVLSHARPAPVFSGLNVRSCRPASRSTSTRPRHACCPR